MEDGRRPDGHMIFLWERGCCLVWDATVMDTYAPSHYKDSVVLPSYAAEIARIYNYQELTINYILQPVAIKTPGVYSVKTAPSLAPLPRNFDHTGDPQEHYWLHQCLLLAVVRGNMTSILNCVVSSTSMCFSNFSDLLFSFPDIACCFFLRSLFSLPPCFTLVHFFVSNDVILFHFFFTACACVTFFLLLYTFIITTWFLIS